MKLELFFIEISCVGFISNNLKSFSNLIKSWGINVNQLVSKCTEVACTTTYYNSTDVENHGMCERHIKICVKCMIIIG